MKKLFLSMLGVSLLLLGSCAQEIPVGRQISNSKMRLTVELDELTREGEAAATRASVASEEGENRVNSLYLLFFDHTDNGSGAYKGYSPVTMPEPSESNPDGNYGMNLDAEVTYPEGLNEDGDYNIFAIANIDDNSYIDGTVDSWMQQWEGKVESYVSSNAMVGAPITGFSSSSLLMHGSVHKPAGDTQVHMMLSRDVSRLDVTNTLADWDLVSVSVWNSFPSAYVWDSSTQDYSENTERIRRHYSVSPNTDAGNVLGKLYAFENQVGSPKRNDHITTCLIIGLQPSAGGPVEYFRANFHKTDVPQLLRRNYVYNLIIEGKDGAGENNEETAYLGESNKLIYRIEDWGEDPGGLVVTDANSTLSIPTKTVNMGGERSVAEIKIHTFSTLASPTPLKIRSQTYRPSTNTSTDPENNLPNKSPIWAELDGNTLVITATKLNGDETERNGVIVLSYAGLEISINVSQSGSHDHFLIVTEPDGGILPFAAYAGIPSGLIRVQASGEWTAKLYMTGFSFDSSQATDPVKMIWSNDAAPGDPDYNFTDGRGYNTTTGLIIPDEVDSSIDKFRVYTHSHNLGQEPREAFILVELDEFPDQYSAVIMLTQNYVKNLHYVHSASDPSEADNRMSSGGTITFDGIGSVPTTGSYAGNNNWWYVFSGYDEGTTNILPWTAVMAIAGGADDRKHFEIVRNEDADGNQIPVNDPAYDPDATNHSTTDVAQNKVKIRALGMNTSGRDYRVTLRVQTDPGTFADIEVIQQSASFELSPGGLLSNKISYLGGSSDPISVLVEGGEGLKWKVASASDITYTEAPVGGHTRRLVHYGEFKPESNRPAEPITLEIVDENGNLTGDTFAYGAEYDINKSFRVKFPKIYFPNRQIAVTASVKITVNAAGATSGGINRTVRVAQNPLEPRPFVARQNSTNANRGNLLADNYSKTYRDLINYIVNTYGTTGSALAYNTGPFDSSINFLHRNSGAFTATEAWENTNAFIDNNEGVFSMIADYQGTAQISGMNRLGRGWTFIAPSATGYIMNWHPDLSKTKLWEFIANRTGSGITLASDLSTNPYGGIRGINYHDGSSSMASTWPASAIPIAVIGTNPANAGFVIDPKDRVIYIGESLYVGDGGIDSNCRDVWNNVNFWIAYASRYGSTFSDLLIEDETAAGGGMPAPWDDWWGANKVTSFDNSYAK